MSVEKDFRLLCEIDKREIIAFKHPTKEKYILVEADSITGKMTEDEKIIIKNQEEAKRILKEVIKENYGKIAVISKNKLNKLMK